MTKILHGRDMNIQSRRYVIPISSFVWENMHCSRAVWHLVEYGMKQTLLPVSFYIRYPNNVKWFIVTDNRHSLKYLCICLIICLSVVVFFFFLLSCILIVGFINLKLKLFVNILMHHGKSYNLYIIGINIISISIGTIERFTEILF